jgi:hypothetical protein
MTVTVKHSTLADGTFSATGATAWDADHTFSGVLPVANGGTNFSSYTTGDILYSSATNTLSKLGIGSTGQVLTVVAGSPAWAAAGGGGMVYPGAGIPNSTGTAWGTSYTISGTGTIVALADSPTFTTAITSTGALQLTGSATVNQNIATTQTTGTLAIGGTGATGTITLGQSTAAQTINIGVSNNTGTKRISIGTTSSTGANIINIGKTSGSCQTKILGNDVLVQSSANLNLTATNISLNTLYIYMPNSFGQNQFFVADLPTDFPTPQPGDRAFAADAFAPVFGATVAGGGATIVPIYYDGTNWKVG